MKRVLTKKPQFSKSVLPERPKRNLKFTHVPGLDIEQAAPAPVMAGGTGIEAEVYDWTPSNEWRPPEEAPAVAYPQLQAAAFEDSPSPAVLAQQSRSLFGMIVAVVLPVLAIGLLSVVIAALAQAGGYDLDYLTARLK